MQFRAPNCAFVRQFAPPLPSLLAVVSVEVSRFLSVAVPGGGCLGYLSGLSEARILLGTPTRLHRHLPQVHLLAMSLIIVSRGVSSTNYGLMGKQTKCARGRFRGHATSGEGCPDNAMQAFVAWRSCFGSCHYSLSTKRFNHLLCKLRQNKCTLVNFRIVILKSHLLNFTLSKYCHRIFKSGVLKMFRK